MDVSAKCHWWTFMDIHEHWLILVDQWSLLPLRTERGWGTGVCCRRGWSCGRRSTRNWHSRCVRKTGQSPLSTATGCTLECPLWTLEHTTKNITSFKFINLIGRHNALRNSDRNCSRKKWKWCKFYNEENGRYIYPILPKKFHFIVNSASHCFRKL